MQTFHVHFQFKTFAIKNILRWYWMYYPYTLILNFIVDLLPHLCMPFKPYLLVFTYNVCAYHLPGTPLIFVAIGVGLRLDQYGTAEQ